MVFDSISSDIDEVLLINPSAVFVFGDFNIHCKDWLTNSVRTDQPGELCYNCSISNGLTQMVYHGITGVHSPEPLLIYLVGPLAISDPHINICVRPPNTYIALKQSNLLPPNTLF